MNNPPVNHQLPRDHFRRPTLRRRFSIGSTLSFIVLALAAAGVIVFLVFGKRIKAAVEPELFNLSYQFLLIVVIGGAISLLLKEFSTRQDRERDRRAILRQMHAELLGAFNTAKRVRRTVRALVGYSTDPDRLCLQCITASDYQKQMDILMEAQLEFEVYAKRADEHELYFAQGAALRAECSKIEDYLREILKEYEISLATFSKQDPGKQLAELPRLAEFIGPFKEGSDFEINFKSASSAVLSGLSRASLT